MRLYAAQFVLRQEHIWYAPDGEVSRRACSHRISVDIFSAVDAEAAYAKALAMCAGFSDANCDEAGDRTEYRCLGLHELEEVLVPDGSLEQALAGPYGIEVCAIPMGEHLPMVRDKQRFEVFCAFSDRPPA